MSEHTCDEYRQKKKTLGVWRNNFLSHPEFFFFFILLKNVIIPNYNKYSKLTLTQKIEESLSMRVSLEASK